MADAFLQILLENVNSLIQGEIGLVMGVGSEMKKLSSTLTTIQAVLEDAEEKQFQDTAIRNWLLKLNDLSYEIDDILDECVTQVAKADHESRKSRFLTFNNIFYKRKIATRMKQVTKRLDDVAAEREKFHLCKTTNVVQKEMVGNRETGSVLNKSHLVYGRDKEKEKIVDILVNQVRDREQLSVLPIVGVGGLGKTTLAQLVFNDERVTQHFDTKLWVCVSNDFDPKTLIKAMIESTTRSGKAANLEHLDSLQHTLLQALSQRRYLLVLDDVWNESQKKWWDLENLLACGSTGSSIIVTTRLKKVANIMYTVPAHYLKGLSEEDCWLLFERLAFQEGEDGHTKLKAIGKQIVQKCAGVPLAAKVLGGLLQSTKNEDDWLRVKRSEIWDLPQEEESILPALRLSYHHLPFALRRCFAYCAVFPKDTWITKNELILHWIAHGYISSTETSKVEDIGNGIFDELVLRSLFQNVKTDHIRQVFKLHDLVHDLARSILDNKFPGAKKLDTKISYNKIRQVDLLRKFVAFPTNTLVDMDLNSIFTKFNRLRILDASDSSIEEVPTLISKLKHVRYLNLSRTNIRTLPDSICDLWNLKILNLNECWDLVSLPKSMRRLRNLRHLFLDWRTPLSEMPPNIGELTCLKTLSMFVVCQGKYNQLGELQFLDLGGNLCIKHLERVEDLVDANKANLREKHNIRELRLIWKTDESCKMRDVLDEKVLEALEPHAFVKDLGIYGFQGNKFPFWMQSYSPLENLVRLCITGCPNCTSLPQVIGELPYLEYLHLSDLAVEYIIEDRIKDVDLTETTFPRLGDLSLFNLPRLKGLLKEEAGVVFPILKKFAVYGCFSFTLPRLQSLKHLSCSSMIFTLFYKLDNLTSLIISFSESMTCISNEALENLVNLQSLGIIDVEEHSLPAEGLQSLKSLTLLNISSETLTCLPRWLSHITALRDLRVYGCPELVEFPEAIKYLHNLTNIHLHNLPKMTCLPNALQHVTSLQSLLLRNLPMFTSLPDWLGNLTSLGSLVIDNCPNLVSFPASTQQLVTLTSLYIIGCPELWRRCEKGKGEDWHKISHISYIRGRK